MPIIQQTPIHEVDGDWQPRGVILDHVITDDGLKYDFFNNCHRVTESGKAWMYEASVSIADHDTNISKSKIEIFEDKNYLYSNMILDLDTPDPYNLDTAAADIGKHIDHLDPVTYYNLDVESIINGIDSGDRICFAVLLNMYYYGFIVDHVDSGGTVHYRLPYSDRITPRTRLWANAIIDSINNGTRQGNPPGTYGKIMDWPGYPQGEGMYGAEYSMDQPGLVFECFKERAGATEYIIRSFNEFDNYYEYRVSRERLSSILKGNHWGLQIFADMGGLTHIADALRGLSTYFREETAEYERYIWKLSETEEDESILISDREAVEMECNRNKTWTDPRSLISIRTNELYDESLTASSDGQPVDTPLNYPVFIMVTGHADRPTGTHNGYPLATELEEQDIVLTGDTDLEITKIWDDASCRAFRPNQIDLDLYIRYNNQNYFYKNIPMTEQDRMDDRTWKKIMHVPDIIRNNSDILETGKYTQLEYIQSSADAYVDLNQMMTPDTGIMVDCQITSYQDTSKHYPIWCIHQESQNYELFVKNQYISVVRWGDSSEVVLPPSSNLLIGTDRHIIDAYQAVYKKDGIIIHTGVRNNVSTSIQPIILFGFINYNGNLDPGHPTGKLYGARLYGDRDVNLVPVRRNSDSVLGLLDTVSNTFYPGSGTWTAGSAFSSPIYKFHKEGQYDYWIKVTQKTPLYDDNGDFYDFSVTGPCIYKDTITGSINVGVQTIPNVLSRKTHLTQDNFDSISVSNDHNSILYSITSNFQTSISSTTTLTYIGNHRNQLLSLPGELVYDCIGVDYSLPDGYTQLEYIQSSSNAYVNLNQMMTPDTGIMVDCQITSYPSTSTYYPIWCMWDGTKSYDLFVKNQYISEVWWGDSSEIYLPTSSNTLIGTDRHIIDAYHAIYKKDGIAIHTGVRNNVSTSIQPIILFAYMKPAGTMDSRHPTGKLYGARLYGDRDVNLVPVRRNSDSVLGLLDTVSNTFYPGSGTWTAGPAFSSPIYKFHKEGQYDYWMKVTQKTPLYDETGNFYDFNITGLSIYKEITGPNMDVGIRTISNILSKKTHLAQDNFDSIAVTNEYNEILHSMTNLI